MLYCLVSPPINIEKPYGWYEISSNNEVYENIERIIVDKSNSKNLIDDIEIKEALLIKAFSKYNLDTYNGLSPMINVSLVKNIYDHNIFSLKKDTEINFINDLTKIALNVKLNKSDFIVLSKKKGFYINISYDLKDFSEKVRSSVYFFMLSDQFFIQISLTDFDNDDCKIIFKKFIEELKF